MTLPVSIAVKLQQMLVQKTSFPASALKNTVVEKMLEDGVLQKRMTGKNKAVILIPDQLALASYLSNHFGVNSLEKYIAAFIDADLLRSDAVALSGNSKLKPIRSFKGFPVNSYEPVEAILNGMTITIHPLDGSYFFISDWETFIPDNSITIVGIENPENFRLVQRQRHLFQKIKPLFICRYPQNNDAIKWLQRIPNHYLHFGDPDFAGINIYMNEYKKWLGSRASFFIPQNLSEMLRLYGNRELYNRQLHMAPCEFLPVEENLEGLIRLFHEHKKVMEQEIFIR